jgi:ElaA protein
MELKAKYFDELNIDELFAIMKARVMVFVVEQKCPYQEIDDIDKRSLHVFFEEDGEVKAYLRSFVKEEGVVQVGRVLSLPHGEGLGRKLMEEALEIIKEKQDPRQIYIEAQTYAIGFYRRFGCEVSSDDFEEDGIPHICMVKMMRSI